jgi:hypothetical protein
VVVGEKNPVTVCEESVGKGGWLDRLDRQEPVHSCSATPTRTVAPICARSLTHIVTCVAPSSQGQADPDLDSACSAELISTPYQPWNSVFLSLTVNQPQPTYKPKNSLPNRASNPMKKLWPQARWKSNQTSFQSTVPLWCVSLSHESYS